MDRLEDKHTTAAQFIIFFILSNGITVLQLVLMPAFKAVFVELVKYGQARGEFRSEISAELVTEMFHSIFQAASFSALPYSFIDNVRLKIELLMDGLKPRHHAK